MVSDIDCDGIEIKCARLTSRDNSFIDAESVEPYIVQIGEQAGLGVYQGPKINVPELLLKDDRVSLKDGYKRSFKHWRHIKRRLNLYSPPSVRLRGNACTALKANQPKQVFVRIQLSNKLQSGTYHGAIDVKTKGGTKSIPVDLEVLPIILLEPKQDLMIWYKGSLDWRNSQHYVTEKVFEAQLKDVYDAGFRSLSFNECDAKYAQKAIDIAERIGFNGHALFNRPYPALETLRFSKLTPVYFLSDELDLHTKHGGFDDNLLDDPHVGEHIINWKRTQDLPGKRLSTIYHESAARKIFQEDIVGHPPELFAYCLITNRDYFYFCSQFSELRRAPSYYYWSAHMEKPNLHRVLAGVYLWKSGATGIQPYCYQHLPKFPFSPFNDFDEWEPNSEIGSVQRSFRDHLATYPAKDGPIQTLQWQGMREGINDLRYITTLDYWLEQASLSHDELIAAESSRIRADRDKFLGRVDLRAVVIISEKDPEPYAAIKPEEYHQFRHQLALAILHLQGLLKTTPPLSATTKTLSAAGKLS